MSNKNILEHATKYFKIYYPGLMAESIVSFLVLIDLDEAATVGAVARAVGMTEPQCYHFIAQLNIGGGVGLVRLENTGDGKNYIHLTDQGEAAKAAVQSAFV
jgi:hypothetical protein